MQPLNTQQFNQFLESGDFDSARTVLRNSLDSSLSRKEKAATELYKVEALLQLNIQLNDQYLKALDERLKVLKDLDTLEEKIDKDIDTRALRSHISSL